jgi:hypothetical protein
LNNSKISSALTRLLANAYPPGDKGAESHRLDVVVLRSAIRGSPDDARRWRWFRERIRLSALHRALDEAFRAPDRAYSAEVDEVIDKRALQESKQPNFKRKPKTADELAKLDERR